MMPPSVPRLGYRQRVPASTYRGLVEQIQLRQRLTEAIARDMAAHSEPESAGAAEQPVPRLHLVGGEWRNGEERVTWNDRRPAGDPARGGRGGRRQQPQGRRLAS